MDWFFLITGAVLGLVSTIVNYNEGKSTQQMDQQNLETAWERDDSTLQRSRTDAEKAGYSPLAGLNMSAGNTSPTQLSPASFDTRSTVDSLGKLSDLSFGKQQMAQEKELQDAQIDLLREQKTAQEWENKVTEATYLDRLQKLRDEGMITSEQLKEITARNLGTHPDQKEVNRHNTALEDEASRHNKANEAEETRHSKAMEYVENLRETNAERQREYDRTKVDHEDTKRYGVSVGNGNNKFYYEVSTKQGYSNAPIFPDLPVNKDNYRAVSITSPQASVTYDGAKMQFIGTITEAELPCYSVRDSEGNDTLTYCLAPLSNGSSYLVNVSSITNLISKGSFNDYRIGAGPVIWSKLREEFVKAKK